MNPGVYRKIGWEVPLGGKDLLFSWTRNNRRVGANHKILNLTIAGLGGNSLVKIARWLRVSKFQIIKVSIFQSVTKVSKLNCSCRIFARYWSHIPEFQEHIGRIFRTSSVLAFSRTVKCLDFRHLDISKNTIVESESGSFLDCLKWYGVSNIINNCFWESWTRPPSPKTHWTADFLGLGKMNPESY